MSNKIVRFTMVLVFLLLFSVTAYADATGIWDITGKAKQRISLKGRSSSQLAGVYDQFEFGSDSSFSMIGLPDGEATWGYVKKKFAVYVNNDNLITSITENLLSELQGYNVEIYDPVITKNSFTGKEMKNGTIKGKWNLVYSAYLYLLDYDVGAKLKYISTINFIGTRTGGLDILTLDPNQPVESFIDSIQGTLMEGISDGIEETLMDIKPDH
jgi:hypothetical protein